MRLIAAAVAVASLAATALTSCGGSSDAPLPAGPLRIATGLDGGVYRVYGRALAGVLDENLKPMRATAVETEGSVDNLQRLDERRAEVGFTLADTASPAVNGEAPFSTR